MSSNMPCIQCAVMLKQILCWNHCKTPPHAAFDRFSPLLFCLAARCGPEGSLKGVPIHFILSFPRDYPHTQPECRLLQPIPHPNVKPAQSVGIQVLHVNPKHQPAPNGAVTGSAAATRSVCLRDSLCLAHALPCWTQPFK